MTTFVVRHDQLKKRAAHAPRLQCITINNIIIMIVNFFFHQTSVIISVVEQRGNTRISRFFASVVSGKENMCFLG